MIICRLEAGGQSWRPTGDRKSLALPELISTFLLGPRTSRAATFALHSRWILIIIAFYSIDRVQQALLSVCLLSSCLADFPPHYRLSAARLLPPFIACARSPITNKQTNKRTNGRTDLIQDCDSIALTPPMERSLHSY